MAKDKREGWIAALKPGDRVVVDRGIMRSVRWGAVQKISPSGMLTVGESVFNPNGEERGAGMCGSQLREPIESWALAANRGRALDLAKRLPNIIHGAPCTLDKSTEVIAHLEAALAAFGVTE